ncbi:hypothetical protein niasHT_025772 [Heterodera trifolii]|uniref:Potassium channel domain-containing protein n=1 Tax=Heterodera trifolii TaxID=157864 RepID=A0ABD2KR75_9BILA
MESVAIQIENVSFGHFPPAPSQQKNGEEKIENFEMMGIGRTQQKELEVNIPLEKVGIHSLASTERLIPPGDAEKGQEKAEETEQAKGSSSSLHSHQWQNIVLSSIGQIGSFVSTTKVFWIVVVYTIFGAYLFIWLEVPKDLEEKRKAYEYHLVVRDALLFKIEQIHKERVLEKTQHWKRAILEFERHLDFHPPQLDTSWTLWMSILYCATIYTTVGYGNIACATTGGRVATIVYAICGIPLMIVVLDQLGTFLLRKMKELSNLIDDLLFFLGVKYRLVRLDDQESFVRYIAICRVLARLRLIPNTITLTITEQEDIEQQQLNAAKSSFSASGASTSSRSSSAEALKDSSVVKICKSSISSAINHREKVSLRLAISKGSILQNIGPFYIESIETDSGPNVLAELDKLSLLSPTAKCQKQSGRRPSKASVTTVQIKLEETDKMLLDITQKSGGTSRKTSAAASAHSETAANETPQLGKSGRSPPLAIALTVTTAWIALSAAVFCLWEEWSYFTSVYFFFISMSTIGFGDVTPEHPQYMIMTFFVVVVGLSLVSVCISVVQEKVSLIYMDFLNKMLQQYMKAKESGDVEALKGAMAGFNDRCKYLMPFISKNQGIRIMNKFKEEAKAMGVELPEVMTELNEDTGKPAFCKIFDEKSDQKVDQFLEQAKQQGKMRRNAHTQTKMALPKTHKFFISKAEAEKEEFEAQTEADATLEKNTQTASSEHSELGVQCSPKMTDEWTEYDEGIWPKRTSTQSQAVINTRNTGVQPEVSCIMRIFDEDESDFPLHSSDYDDGDDDADELNYAADALSSSVDGFSRLGSPADALSSSQQSQLLSGSSREGELERRLSVGSKRSAQMRRVPEIELEDDKFTVGQRFDHSRKKDGQKCRETNRSDIETTPETMPRRRFARPLSPPPLVTIRMASKTPTEEEIGEETKKREEKQEEEKWKRRRNMRKTAGGIRYMRNIAIQVESDKKVADKYADFTCQFDSDSTEGTKSNEKEKQQKMMVDKWTQHNISEENLWQNIWKSVEKENGQKRKGMEKDEEEGEKEDEAEKEEKVGEKSSRTEKERSEQTQSEFNLKRKCKRSQTERLLLVSRPAQTQLSSTFRRSDGDGREEGKAEGESEAQIEPHFEREKEREELKRVFGVENEDIEELRQRMMQMKEKRREDRRRRRREDGQSEESGGTERKRNTSSEEEDELDEEEKDILINEIKKMKSRRRRVEEQRKKVEEGKGEKGTEEEEEEEEDEEEEKGTEEEKEEDGEEEKGTEEEKEEDGEEEKGTEDKKGAVQEKLAIGRRKGKKRRKGRGGKSNESAKEEFTLLISQPAERGHIKRENYEETILDIQLIRSPFFETRYLPQSEEKMVYDEVEMDLRERKRKKGAEEAIEIDKLLNKLNKLEALSTGTGAMEKHLDSIEKQLGQIRTESGEEIGQFTAESAAQTEETEEDERMAQLAKLWGKSHEISANDLSEIIRLIDEFKQFDEGRRTNLNISKWDKWTQTEGQMDEKEQKETKEEEEKSKRGQRIVERVVAIWRGKRDRERPKTAMDGESGKSRNEEVSSSSKEKMKKKQTQQKRKQTIQQIGENEQENTDQETKTKEETETYQQVKSEIDQETKTKEETDQQGKRGTDQKTKTTKKETETDELMKKENDQERKTNEETETDQQMKRGTDQERKTNEETETDQQMKRGTDQQMKRGTDQERKTNEETETDQQMKRGTDQERKTNEETDQQVKSGIDQERKTNEETETDQQMKRGTDQERKTNEETETDQQMKRGTDQQMKRGTDQERKTNEETETDQQMKRGTDQERKTNEETDQQVKSGIDQETKTKEKIDQQMKTKKEIETDQQMKRETDQEMKTKQETDQQVKSGIDQETKTKEETDQQMKRGTDQLTKLKGEIDQQAKRESEEAMKSKEETDKETEIEQQMRWKFEKEIEVKEEKEQQRKETDLKEKEPTIGGQINEKPRNEKEMKLREEADLVITKGTGRKMKTKSETDEELKKTESQRMIGQKKQESDQKMGPNEEIDQMKRKTDQQIKVKEGKDQIKRATDQKMNRTEREGMIRQNVKEETEYESYQKVETRNARSEEDNQQRSDDQSRISLVLTKNKTIELRKIRKQTAIEGDEAEIDSELMTLETDQLAKLREIFPELMEVINAKEEEGQQQQKRQLMHQQMICSTEPSSSTSQFGEEAERNKEQKQQQQNMEDKMAKSSTAEEEETEEAEVIGRSSLRLMPLLNLLEGNEAAVTALPVGIQPWPIAPGPPQLGQSQLHYFRQWIENLLELARDKKQPNSLYDVPLRSIAEFLRERRRELDELERQKQQLERMAELAARGESAERMVNVSIQAGVHSRVVPIMGAREGHNLQDEEFDYLTNPTYPIVRIALELEEQSEEEKKEEKEKEKEEEEEEKE